MKYGVRKPSIKRSVKAHTTAGVKRSAKSALNPLYGKKGTGYVHDPGRAVSNHIYHKTTVGVPNAVRMAVGTGTSQAVMKQPPESEGELPEGDSVTVNYRMILKRRAGLAFPALTGVISLLLVSNFLLFLVFLGISLAFFIKYFAGKNNPAYASKNQLNNWKVLVETYSDEPVTKVDYDFLTQRSKEVLDPIYNWMSRYHHFMEQGGMLSPKDYLNLYVMAGIVLEFSPYLEFQTQRVQMKTPYLKGHRTDYIDGYLKAKYEEAVTHAQSLKTQRGRSHQIDRYKSAVARDLEELYPDYLERMEPLIHQDDFFAYAE